MTLSDVRLRTTRHAVAGIGFDPVTEDEVVAVVLEGLRRGSGGTIATPNIDMVRQLQDEELRALVERFDLVVADGMPLVWLSRFRPWALPERVTGSSLVWSLTAAAAAEKRSVYLLGGAPGIAEAAAHSFERHAPGLEIAGWACPEPGFERHRAGIESVLDDVVETKPDLVFVALGFPKQERVITALAEHLPRTWFLGCGGALTMAAGAVPRAPEWMQRSGLEWAHRLGSEPRRMAQRYLVDDMPYARRLFLAALRTRAVRRGPVFPSLPSPREPW